ncbi:SRPBCC family protein [Actinokineospora inagensis]|uniref:SRPBCC family protein n=1 Tax=Actinokineospora inagensis TaxID=103730 RepID=UPI000425D865|nr:SRPBCC domain-containing protein [Actinokineospora inagensis]
MVDIRHRIGVRATPDDVYTALTTVDGLSRWWTEDTTDDGGVLKFRFIPGGFDMVVLETRPAELVRWEVVAGPDEWVGTTVTFALNEEDGYTIVLFGHEGWREAGEFMSHCTTKWGTFLLSLKNLVETGEGAPAPRDVQISNWH